MKILRESECSTLGTGVYVTGDQIYGLLILGDAKPSDEDWHVQCLAQEFLLEYVRTHAIRPQCVHLLTIAGNGMPSAKQRAAGSAIAQGYAEGTDVHVITSSVLIRGVMTAFRWLLPSFSAAAGMKIHHLSRLGAVADEIGIDRACMRTQLLHLSRNMSLPASMLSALEKLR